MCKRIKDILWPLNVLGKKKKSATYKLSGDPLPHTIPVEWWGDQLRITFTFYRRVYTPYPRTVTIPITLDFANGDGATETITTWRNGFAISEDWTLHFNCTNVTKLIVNGEQII